MRRTFAEFAVVVGGILLIAALAWYFFAPRKATDARVEGGRQVVDITVKGGYSPSLVKVEAGKPSAPPPWIWRSTSRTSTRWRVG